MIDRAVIWQPADLARLKPITGSNPVRPVDSIVIHHTGGGVQETPQGIHAYHLRPESQGGAGYGGCGYHFLIDRDFRTWRGRPLWARGAHCKSNNSGRIGIALMGNYNDAAPAAPMVRMAMGLIAQLQALYGDLPVFPHYSMAGSVTDCPGRACVQAFVKEGLEWAAM